jgi:hypothetical protein
MDTETNTAVLDVPPEEESKSIGPDLESIQEASRPLRPTRRPISLRLR